MMKSILLLSVLFLCNVPTASAWQQIAPDTINVTIEHVLQTVEISATRYKRPIYRIPYSVDVLDQGQIQSAEQGQSLEESVRSLPGIIVHNRNNMSQGDRISIRGLGSRASFGVRGIKLILDGIPLTMADGQSQLNNLDLTSIGKIEVLRGPSSSLYGNAAGGVLQINTEEPTAAPLTITPKIIIGSFGLRRILGKVSGHLGENRFLVNLNMLWSDGYRDHAFARSNGLNAVGSRKLSNDLNLNAVFHYINAPYQFNPSSLNKSTAVSNPTSARSFVQRQGAAKKMKQVQGGISLKYQNDIEEGELTVFGVRRDLFNPIPGRIIDLERNALGIRGLVSKKGILGNINIRLTAGLDLERQQDGRKEYDNEGIPGELVGKLNNGRVFDMVSLGNRQLDQVENVSSIGTFLELGWTLRPNLNITFGGRYDRFGFKVNDQLLQDGADHSGSRNMSEVSPQLGVAYRLTPLTAIYGNFSTAFQTPTTSELSNQPTQTGGFNLELKPERLRGFEAGIKGSLRNSNINYNAALFSFDITNMLQPFQIEQPETDEIYYRNAGETRNSGLEIKLDWEPTPEFNFAVAYTGMRFKFRDYKVEQESDDGVSKIQLSGNRVPGVPPHHLFGRIKYFHQRTGVFFEMDAQWFAEYFANDFNGPASGSGKPKDDFINESYGVVDFRTGITYNNDNYDVLIFAGVNNFLNKRYNGSIVPNSFGDRFFEPAPGRFWYIGLGVPINPDPE